jgi:hypothetical protein
MAKICFIYKLLDAHVKPHGAEKWTWTKADISRLKAAEVKISRGEEGTTSRTERGRNK